MKKLIAAFAITALAFGSCTTTPTPVTVSLSSASANEIGLVTTTKQVALTVTNSTNQSATINWERTETTAVTGWTYLVNGATGLTGTLSIPAGTSATVTLTINANGLSGTGAGNIKFYDAADQTATMKTFTYNYSTVTSYFSISPVGLMTRSTKYTNPAQDYHIWVINNNNVAVPVTWKRTAETANLANWTVVVCTDSDCYTPTIYTEDMMIAPGDSVDFKATVDHLSTAGSGGTTALFYVAADSATSVLSQVISHTANP